MCKRFKILNDLILSSMTAALISIARNVGRMIISGCLSLIVNMADGQKIDSLKSLLNQKNGNIKCDILYQIAYEYIDVDNQLGLHYAKQAFKAAQEDCDSLRIVKAGRIKSLAFRRLGELDSSKLLSIEMLPIATSNHYKDELILILKALALIYSHEANYDKALNYYFQSLDISKNDKNVWVILNNIGIVYYKLQDYDKALNYYQQALNCVKDNNSEDAYTLINMSLCYSYKKNYEAARSSINKAFSICGTNCSSIFVMQARFSLGLIDFGLNDLAIAESKFTQSYKLSKELNDERFLLDNIIYLSKINIRQNELNLAERYLNEAEQLVANGTPYNLELIKVYNELYRLYERLKKFNRMAYYQNKYIQLKDSIYGEELTRNLMRVESEYLERENRAKIDAQSQILALNEDVIFHQRVLNTFTGVIAILLASLTFTLIRINRQKRAANLFLEQKVKERTIELERNNDALLRSMEEQALIFQKVSSDIKSSIATIKGLCSLSLAESESSFGGQYVHKIQATSDQLLRIIERTLKPTR